MKIERELERKIREKEQRARLDKVLAAAELKVKTDVEVLKKREQEKRDAVNETLEGIRKKERLKQKKADKDRLEEDKNREKKLSEVRQQRMATILKFQADKKQKQEKVAEFKKRMQEEEA